MSSGSGSGSGSASGGSGSSSGVDLDGAASSSGSGGDDGATPREGGTSTDGSSTADGASEGGGGPGKDGGLASDGSTKDAGGGHGLACGNVTCSASTQTCCASFSGTGTATACLNGQICPGLGSTALHCTSAADCSGQTVCCLARQPTGAGSVAECRTNCASNDAQLCDPKAADPGCLQGQRCQPPNGGAPPLPSGVGECGG